MLGKVPCSAPTVVALCCSRGEGSGLFSVVLDKETLPGKDSSDFKVSKTITVLSKAKANHMQS